MPVVDVIEDGRLDEIAAIERGHRRHAAASRELRFALADLLILADAIVLLAADQRAHFCRSIERRADRNRLRLLDHRVEEFPVDRALHENPAAGGADFTLVEEDAEQRALDGHLEIRIRKKDIRRLAA